MTDTVVEKLTLRGDVDIKLYDQSDNLIRHDEVRNLITTAGKQVLASNLLANRGDAETVDAISIGTGLTEPQATDLLMEDPVAEREVRFELLELNFASFLATFEENVGTGETISEIGLYGSKRTLICHTLLSRPFEKSATDYLVINWKLQIG